MTETGDIHMNAMNLINAALAMPHTHAVVTKFADGGERKFTTRNLASAQNFAVGERRKIGKDLISREANQKVRIVAVEVVEI
jgi:hypothetical protein